MDIADTRYAITEDGVHIAYQVVGDGPVDIVFVHAFVTHLELMWELPSFEQLIRSLSSSVSGVPRMASYSLRASAVRSSPGDWMLNRHPVWTPPLAAVN